MIVLKTNGTTLSLNTKSIYRTISKIEFVQRLLSEDVINITVETKYPIFFNIGDKIEHNNKFYHLNFAPKVKREQGIYTYDLTFEGSQYLLRQKVYFNLDKESFQTTADFSLTGEIEIFLRVLITNINSLNQENWILGDFPQDTETKTLSFNGENCLAVLQKICQEYDTEFEIIQNQNNYTLNIKKIGKTLPYVFQYGKGNGLYSLSRENINNDVVTRLYAFGSTENIPSDYRNYSDRLRMPDEDYIQDNAKVALFGLKEGVKNFDDIKPTFKGIISEVKPFNTQTKTQDIVVSNMDFDLNERDSNGTKWLINDTPAKLHFNKGNLAGYSFELSKNNGYNHATKTFKIKQWTDERGQVFPDPNTNAFIFNIGDEFTLLDIVMPPVYINNAENKLLEEAQKEYEKQSKNNAKYSLEIDPLFLAQSNTNTPFEIGDYLRVIDTDLNIDKTSRIIGISQDLNEPFKYQLDIADDYEINFTLSVLNDIKDTQTIIKTQEQVNRQQHLNSIRNLAELRESVFDTEGYFDPQNIKPQSIETNMLSVGAKNQQFALENVTLNPNVNGNPNSLYISGGKLVHFSISENIKEWTLLPIHKNDLTNLTYYVYAKVGINDSFGTWEITTEKIKFNERSGYYYFLCYLLYTPKEGKRNAEAMYGNVMMHGGQISAGRIKSLNGQTYIDLDTGEISGKITFLSNSPALTQVQGMVDNINIGGRNLISNSLIWSYAPNNVIISATKNIIKTKITNLDSISISRSDRLQKGFEAGVYTLSGRISVNGSIPNFDDFRMRKWVGVLFRSFNQSTGDFIVTQEFADSTVYPVDMPIYSNAKVGDEVTFINLKLEKGNKATDWTPAPEDLEAQFQNLQNGITNVQSSMNDVKTKTDNFTSIQGGLLSSNIISVGSTQVNQNAFISGVTDAGGMSVRFGAGANYENRNNAPFRVLDNGKMIAENADISGKINAESGKIGSFHIDTGLTSYHYTNDSWANNNQYVRITPESFLMRKNGERRGEHKREIFMGTTTWAGVGWDGPVVKIENTMPPEFAFVQRDNVALYLNAKNANKDNVALDIPNGDIRVGGEKGITGEVRIGTRKIRFKNGIAVETI